MMKMVLMAAFVAAGAGLALEPAQGQLERSNAVEGLAFAYVNAAGTQLLTVDAGEEVKPTTLSTAICGEAQQFTVRYLQFQKRTARDNGRQSTGNFGNDEGHLFAIVGGRANPGDTCLLAPSAFLKAAPAVRNEFTRAERDAREAKYAGTDADARERNPDLFMPAGAAAQAAIRRIEEAKGRAIKTYWPLYRFNGNSEVAVVEFLSIGNSRLAALILVEPDRLSFFDMPADGAQGDCWRVDDSCVLNPSAMDVPVVFRGPAGMLILFTWWGAEGQDITLFQAKEGQLTKVGNRYRYHSPV
ncbi:MAG TPA: hypothetical protein VFY29_16205 [Terriglobia bacterium]|nr:hypothetical protein [Terriglobia bacterium]